MLLFLFSISFFTSCRSDSNKNEKQVYYHDQGEIFTTGYSIKYQHTKSLKNEIEAELDKFDHSLNPFKENSIITKVNNNELVELDSFFMNVFKKIGRASCRERV